MASPSLALRVSIARILTRCASEGAFTFHHDDESPSKVHSDFRRSRVGISQPGTIEKQNFHRIDDKHERNVCEEMQFLDLTLPTVAENVALDEALLLGAEAGGPEVLRLWHWPAPAIVLGAAGRIADDVHEEACQRDGLPIVRRSSGGGTVLLGTGCLLYSLVLRFDHAPGLADLQASYRVISDRIQRALKLPILLEGSSDMTFAGRKFSGNAQQRKRTHFLHHGTILYAYDFTAIERYLKLPPRQPVYRQGRTHADFLGNLPLSIEELIRAIRSAWPTSEALGEVPISVVAQLVKEKYETEAWTHRR